MSALPITGPREERGAFFRLGQLGYKLGQAEADAREHKARALEAERLLEAVGKTLDLDTAILTEIGQADPAYFGEAREQLLKGLRDWNEEQKIPVCLSCGSPLVDWIATASECGWRCQDCGAIEDRAGDGRRSAA